jgi:hypothetical protein
MISIFGAVTFSFAAILYILLLFGLPLGEFAMGGKYKVLPAKLRVTCAVSVLVQVFAIMIILQTGGIVPLLFSQGITRGLCFFFAVYLSLNVIMNFLSKSKKEKWTFGPISLITAVCYWVTALKS